MTLLSICQNVADEIGIGIDSPPAIIGSAEDTARRLLSAAQREGKILALKDWVVLHFEHEFSTVASQAEYALPSGFSRFLIDTAWDRTNFRRVRGGVSPAEWQLRRSAILAISDFRRAYRVKASSAGVRVFTVDPTPSSIDSLVFEYASNQWCESSVGAGQTSWLADDDVPRIDETVLELGVRWRVLQRLGLSYLDEKDEYDRILNTEFARDYGPETLNMGTRRTKFLVNLPETGFG